MALDFDSISSALNSSVAAAEAEVESLQNTNLSDSSNMLLFQQAINEWTVATGLQSTTIKALRDALQGIVQKM